MEEKEQPTILHKLEAGRKVRVFKSTFNDRNYYKIQLSQKNYDDTVYKFYIALQFKKGVELDDPDGKGIDIIINKAIENFRPNSLDKYNPILYYMVTDFEIVERQEQIEQQAYNDFRENLDEIENGIDVTDDMLPF